MSFNDITKVSPKKTKTVVNNINIFINNNTEINIAQYIQQMLATNQAVVASAVNPSTASRYQNNTITAKEVQNFAQLFGSELKTIRRREPSNDLQVLQQMMCSFGPNFNGLTISRQLPSFGIPGNPRNPFPNSMLRMASNPPINRLAIKETPKGNPRIVHWKDPIHSQSSVANIFEEPKQKTFEFQINSDSTFKSNFHKLGFASEQSNGQSFGQSVGHTFGQHSGPLSDSQINSKWSMPSMKIPMQTNQSSNRWPLFGTNTHKKLKLEQTSTQKDWYKSIPNASVRPTEHTLTEKNCSSVPKSSHSRFDWNNRFSFEGLSDLSTASERGQSSKKPFESKWSQFLTDTNEYPKFKEPKTRKEVSHTFSNPNYGTEYSQYFRRENSERNQFEDNSCKRKSSATQSIDQSMVSSELEKKRLKLEKLDQVQTDNWVVGNTVKMGNKENWSSSAHNSAREVFQFMTEKQE